MKSIVLLLALGMSAYCASAQSISPSTLNATGGSAAIAGNVYEWSVGEMTLVHTASAGSLTVTQGLLQPKASQVGINDVPLSLDQLSVYPNPTGNFVYLETKLNASAELHYSLYDVLGKSLIMHTYKIPSGKEKIMIDLAPFAAGSYYLNVQILQQGSQYRNSFEIKKVQ
ncbi:hypothetical protein D3C72_573880 [compost metagenome]